MSELRVSGFDTHQMPEDTLSPLLVALLDVVMVIRVSCTLEGMVTNRILKSLEDTLSVHSGPERTLLDPLLVQFPRDQFELFLGVFRDRVSHLTLWVIYVHEAYGVAVWSLASRTR